MSFLDDLLGKRVMLGDTILPDRKIIRFVPSDGVALTVEDNSSTDDGLGSTDVSLGGMAPIIVTEDTILVPEDNTAIVHNLGAVGDVIVTLPSAPGSFGISFTICVAAAHYLKLKAPSSHVIVLDAMQSAAAGYVRSNYLGAGMRICYLGSNTWFCQGWSGPWTVDA